MTSLDPTRFHHLWTRLTASTGFSGGAHRAFRRLRRAHRQFWRSYHDTSHVVAVLAELDSVRALLDDPDAAEMAIWFHDAVYVPWLRCNEEKSAGLARRFLESTDIDSGHLESGHLESGRLDRIVDHILATRHQAEPEDPDSRLVVDADLAILGSPPDRYDEYERQVRREYIWVPKSKYRAGRSAILRQFLERPSIYSTDSFRDRFEDQARFNLETAVSRLQN